MLNIAQSAEPEFKRVGEINFDESFEGCEDGDKVTVGDITFTCDKSIPASTSSFGLVERDFLNVRASDGVLRNALARTCENISKFFPISMTQSLTFTET